MMHDTINDTTLSIVEKFGKNAIRRSIMSLRNGDAILRQATEKCGKTRCVEIGTFLGVTTAFLATIFDEVFTIDLRKGQREEVSDAGIYTGESREAIWKYLGLEHKIKMYLINHDADKWHVFNNASFDFAFLDGGDDCVQNDFNYTKKCGHVLFHDVSGRRPAISRVVKALPHGNVRYFSNDNSDADIFALWSKM